MGHSKSVLNIAIVYIYAEVNHVRIHFNRVAWILANVHPIRQIVHRTFGVQRIVCRNNIVYLSAPQCGDFSALRLARTIAEFIHFGVQNCKRRRTTDAFLLHDALEVSLESEDESQVLIVLPGNCYDLISYVAYSRLWPFVQHSERFFR